jgi:hypothetical protein
LKYQKKEGLLKQSQDSLMLASLDRSVSSEQQTDYIKELLETNIGRRQTINAQFGETQNPLLEAQTKSHFEQAVRKATIKRQKDEPGSLQGS